MGLQRTAAVGAVASGAWAFIRIYRPWHHRWGATDREVAEALPGDELLPIAEFRPTRAITIDARPEEIWPWIVQIGYDRAGFYAYDLLDHLGKPSAERIIPEFQDPHIGDWIAMSPNVNETTAFRVAAFEPNRWMLWSKPDSTWCWSLRPIDAERTRLVCRIKARYEWTKPIVILSVLLLELGDFPMSRRELLGIKRRAEGIATARRSSLDGASGPQRIQDSPPVKSSQTALNR
jgi:hypothetical protein